MFSQALRQARFSLPVHYILLVKELVDHVKNKLNVIGLVLFIPFLFFCAITCCQELLFKVTFLHLLIPKSQNTIFYTFCCSLRENTQSPFSRRQAKISTDQSVNATTHAIETPVFIYLLISSTQG